MCLSDIIRWCPSTIIMCRECKQTDAQSAQDISCNQCHHMTYFALISHHCFLLVWETELNPFHLFFFMHKLRGTPIFDIRDAIFSEVFALFLMYSDLYSLFDSISPRVHGTPQFALSLTRKAFCGQVQGIHWCRVKHNPFILHGYFCHAGPPTLFWLDGP